MSATTSVHRCAICNARLKRWVYSRSTGNRYCVDIDACRARSRRRGR